ncbi:tRNA-uridine aminocarboxypropyltransferase [Comamonas sp. B-9]|uniref:tRNA-uridine aminocarboxypropyltransferase n=1 Tax=Comamonas sp. B-9 TaxID=1055192 RepID=UPI001EF9ECEF|nr:tRNA-uridine aminocarboxypropyltransferase [Comamonas sp. B-9]
MSASHATPVLSAPRRAQCPNCLRPQSACICALAQPLQAATQVLILQHPLELQEAKGTARLLQLCLPGSQLVVGEAFDPGQLQQWLHGPWPGAEAPQQTLLLYPQTPDQPAALTALAGSDAPVGVRRLVLIDGTWRKSRKMLYANPLLAQLPRLALTDTGPAGYRIRKAPRAGQLSTLEAAALALQQLEAWPDGAPPLQALQQSFDGLIAQYERLRAAH